MLVGGEWFGERRGVWKFGLAEQAISTPHDLAGDAAGSSSFLGADSPVQTKEQVPEMLCRARLS